MSRTTIICGPAGSGKTHISNLLATDYKFKYVVTQGTRTMVGILREIQEVPEEVECLIIEEFYNSRRINTKQFIEALNQFNFKHIIIEIQTTNKITIPNCRIINLINF
jgi:cytidylate kinase